MKLIDAEAFAQRTHERFNRKSEALVIGTSGYTGDLTDMEYFDRWLDQQPEIEAEPVKHGRWLNEHLDENGEIWRAECSNCKNECTDYFGRISITHKYCENCGAKMDGGTDDDNP